MAKETRDSDSTLPSAQRICTQVCYRARETSRLGGKSSCKRTVRRDFSKVTVAHIFGISRYFAAEQVQPTVPWRYAFGRGTVHAKMAAGSTPDRQKPIHPIAACSQRREALARQRTNRKVTQKSGLPAQPGVTQPGKEKKNTL
jgi:hypothetical protein